MNSSSSSRDFEERMTMPIGSGVLLATIPSHTPFFPEDIRLFFQDLLIQNPSGVLQPLELPNPFGWRLVVDGHPIPRNHRAVVHFDVQSGTWSTELAHELPRGFVRESIRVFAAMGSPYLLLMDYSLQTDWNAFVEIATGETKPYQEPIHRLSREVKDNSLIWRGDAVKHGSRFVVAEQIQSDPPCQWSFDTQDHALLRKTAFEAKAGIRHRFWNIVFASHSDTAAYDNPLLRIERATRKGISVLEKSTAAFWKAAWDRYLIDVKGEEPVDQALRKAMYRLLITRPVSSKVLLNIEAEEEQQVIQSILPWIDIERFGVYVNVDKAAATAVVRRIVQCLPRARETANRFSKRGAAYLGSVCQLPNEAEGHPVASTAKVASLLVDYMDRTDVPESVLPLVYEALIETVRFLISCQSKDGRFLRIANPDMVHPIVDQDASTVFRMEYVLKRTIEIMETARDAKSTVYLQVTAVLDARRDLVLYKNALTRWKPPNQLKGVIEAFEGYFALSPVDTSKETFGPERLGELRDTQMLEVPSVLDVFRLFPERYVKSVVKANWEYYSSRACRTHARNGILLGIVNYQFQLGKFGYPEFLECLGLKERKEPLPNQMLPNLEEMLRYDAHSYFMIVYGFGAVQLSGKYVKASANLPSTITSVRFRIVHRKNVATVKVGKEKCEWKWDVGGALK
jgi:trehalose/maltose hydrolase-like predicted phosphorylase